MVSFAFLLCSTLLLSVATAAPYPDAGDDATAVATIAPTAANGARETGKSKGMIHSFLKRFKELNDGVPIEKVVGKAFLACSRKLAGKCQTWSNVHNSIGSENAATFGESAAKMVKDTVLKLLDMKKDAKAITAA